MRKLAWTFSVGILAILLLLINAPPAPTVAEACQREFGVYGPEKVKDCELRAMTTRLLEAQGRQADKIDEIARTAR